MSCKSGIEPLQLGFNNVTLTTDGQANSNGLAVQIGTPGQILALTPSTLTNNTLLTNRATCGSNANTSCIESIGGGYDASASTSFLATTANAWNGSVEDITYYDLLVNAPTTYFNDDLKVASNQKSYTLPGFPFLLNPVLPDVYSQLGIGPNSTFINRLVEAGLAPSHSWSFFPGVYSQLRAGLLIIGGYADRFYQGTLQWKNVTDSNGAFYYYVSSMVYEDGDRTVDLMPDGTSHLEATIDPWYPSMIVPNDTLTKFGQATNGTWTPDLLLYSYPSGSAPTGNITITLRNNLTTTIPYQALFDPPAYDNGILADYRHGSNSAVYGVLQSWAAYVKDPPTTNIAVFGMPYAAQVYLVRDYERNTIGIANANQGAQINGDVISICALDDSGHGSSSHVGAIAGGVVGGVVGLALLALLAWFLLRRKKRSATLAPETKDPDAMVSTTPAGSTKPELAASGTVVQNRSSVEKSVEPISQKAEMSNETSRVEMPGTQAQPPVEMQGTQAPPPAELPGQTNVVRSELPG